MPLTPEHPADWTLELHAEGALAPEEQRRVSAHVDACAGCTAEIDSYRALFAAMAELPQYEPSADFAATVMARVTIAKPAMLPSWLTAWTPSSWQGWTVLLGLCMAPAAPIIAAVWWIATHPDWSFTSLWDAGTTWAQIAGWSVLVNVLGTAAESRLAFWGRFALDGLLSVPIGVLVIGAVLLAIGIPVSAWTLYRTLRTPTRGPVYAH